MLDQNGYLAAHGKEGQEVPGHDGNKAVDGISEVFTHGGQFIQYNLLGIQFEVSAKYRRPIKPINRGAYGIVW